MTVCKYKENRIVPIQYKKSDASLFSTAEYFNLFLINSGSVVFRLNGKECFLCGKVVVCTNNLDEIQLIYQSKTLVKALRFKPEFINVNLSWDVIKRADYKELCKKNNYPDFNLFLKRSSIYSGILQLDEDGSDKINDKMCLLEYQLSQQPDNKWSCRSRGILFEIMDILNLYYKKYISSDYYDSFVWDICQHINLNLASALSLEYLSNRFSVNRTTLSERFKTVIGLTLSEYIRSKRIDRIKYLLAFTELHLSEIGGQVGYSDPTYLSKVFMKSTGITPLKYRHEMQNTRLINQRQN